MVLLESEIWKTIGRPQVLGCLLFSCHFIVVICWLFLLSMLVFEVWMHHGVPLVFGCLHFFGLYFAMIGLLLQLVMLLP